MLLQALNELDQIAGSTERRTPPLLVEDRDHDNGRIGELHVLTQGRQHRPAVEIRHHHVEGNGNRMQFFGNFNTFEGAIRRHHLEALGRKLLR
jgi:hypothetical protein